MHSEAFLLLTKTRTPNVGPPPPSEYKPQSISSATKHKMPPTRRVTLANPGDATSPVTSMFCYDCRRMKPAENYYPSRLAWRRGCCTACDQARAYKYVVTQTESDNTNLATQSRSLFNSSQGSHPLMPMPPM